MSALPVDLGAEWLEADGAGGFASGTVGGERTRRYHALLLSATTPPTGRLVLVNGIEAWIESATGTSPLSTQRYLPDVTYPDGKSHLVGFVREPWPTWTFALPNGIEIEHEIFVEPNARETVLRWRLRGRGASCRLRVRLLLSGRDYHALHRENATFRFEPSANGGNVCWRPYPGVPPITALSDGAYEHAPEWYRNFLYIAERDRGLDDIEDLASPGVLTFDLMQGGLATIVLRAGDDLAEGAAGHGETLATSERTRRTSSVSPIVVAARSYVVARGGGQTLIAGFPWFTDWGRDTFIAMRGLALASGDLAAAESILVAWAGTVSQGMLPNRFPDQGTAPEYNAVDASLWFIIAVHEFLDRCESARRTIGNTPNILRAAGEAILDGYTTGTRFGIAADVDGLLRAGVPGVQLTWMDARIDDHVVTPRIGKPVEVQALWINALRIAAQRWAPRWVEPAARAQTAFAERFLSSTGGLLDVIDADHVAGRNDASLRPNQILAVGGLPFPLLEGKTARAVVDLVEARLLTPLGLRTLAPDDPAYAGQYRGGPAARDGAYHQGTAWPWLMGPFVDAWLAVRDRTEAAKTEAGARFLAPLMAHLEQAGLGHVSEVADGDPPHTPGGCPFQAWSLGELIRIRHMLEPALEAAGGRLAR